MPSDKKHHTDKFRRCVEQVVGKGHEESSAYAICTTSLQNAGEPIFEAAEERMTPEILNLHANVDADLRAAISAGGETRTLHLLGATGPVRREELNGRKHLVVPVVALMEGVIHAVNAETPEYVSGDVLKRAAASWVGKPVTLGHPVREGKQCSASDATVRKDSGIGVIMKSEYVEHGKRLQQEAWIDEEKAKKVNEQLYESLAAGGREEVSVGAMVVANAVGGNYNGKQYKGAWLETAGDHLAFLPGGRGACSCEMGCGTFRAAMHLVTDDEIQPMTVDTLQLLADRSLDEMFETIEEWAEAYRMAGDFEGHPFRGNQHVSAAEAHDEAARVHEAAAKSNVSSSTAEKATKEASKASDKVSAGTAYKKRPDGLREINKETAAGKAAYAAFEARQSEKRYETARGPQASKSALESRARYHKEAAEHHRSQAEIHRHIKSLEAKKKDCPMCQGTGSKDGNPCEACSGKGKLKTAENRIKQEGGKHILYSKDGERRLAEHLTRAAAEAHLGAIEELLAMKVT